ncbi:zinc ribbon domain-containing protein [Streptomyces avermitilis]
MASYCPHCGAPSPAEARFCMRCGRERVADASDISDAPEAPDASAPEVSAAPEAPAVPPVAPPVGPPPPAYAPGPARPSPVGAFLGRTFRGDWAGAAQAALWPVGLLLVSAVALGIPKYGQDSEEFVGFGDRLRIALALLLQALGGGFEVKAASGSGYGPGTGFGGGYDQGAAGDVTGGGSFSLVPLTVTVLWIAALCVGVRLLRGRLAVRAPGSLTAGLEAAVRVALLVTGAVLLLGLFAQPTIAGVEISASPALSALGALLLSLAVACGVLHRVGPDQWWAAHPGARTLLRATGTALRALTVVLALCSVVAFITVARLDDLDQAWSADGVSPLLVALLVLPNLAVLALGLSWGVPVGARAQGSSPYGGGYEHHAFGLSELADVTNAWAVVGALALGVVCALILGVVAARRSTSRGEQVLAAGVFLGLFLILAGLGGVGTEMSGSTSSDFGSSGLSAGGTLDAGLSFPEALLFGLLWISAATFVAPYLVRVAGGRTGMSAPPTVPPGPPVSPVPSVSPVPPVSPVPQPPVGRPMPPVPPMPSTPAHTPTAYDLHAFPLGPPPAAAPKPRSRAVVWAVTLAVAFVVGGGAAAGVLVWQEHQKGDTSSGKPRTKPTATASDSPSATPFADPTSGATDTATDEATDEATDRATDGATGGATASPFELPAGYHRLDDPFGFSLAVPDVWAREGVKNGTQVTYAGSTGLEHLQVGVIANAGYTSYDNFLTLEKTAKKKDAGYQRIRLERNTFQGRDGAIWEYTYTDGSGRTVHAADQGYVAEDGTEYAIMLVGKDELWEGGLAETFRVALDSWQLT